MLSADIIDMSFINAGNTLDKYVHYKLSKIGAKEWVMRNVNGMIVPYLTPHYLFYDLCSIIIETSVYPWDDKKYGKRLDRLINMGILSAVTIYGSARLKPYIYFVLQRINELRGLDPETAFKLISTYTTIDDDLTFNVRTNYFTFEILKSIVKSVIYMYFVSNVSIGGNISNVSTNVAKFVNKNLAFIFEGKSEITRDMFMKNADINQYHVYVDSVYTKLDLYHDLFNKIPDIVITENESISHDKI
jgi:hypothetical protein